MSQQLHDTDYEQVSGVKSGHGNANTQHINGLGCSRLPRAMLTLSHAVSGTRLAGAVHDVFVGKLVMACCQLSLMSPAWGY